VAPRMPFASRHGPILDFADTRTFSTLAESRPSGIPPLEGLLPYASRRDPDMGGHLAARLG